MASLNITVSGIWPASDFGIARTGDPRENLKKLASLLTNLAQGVNSGVVTIAAGSADAVAATSTVTATTSGNLGTVINGTTVTTTFVTSQDATATAAVADVNANTTVNKLVTATKGGTGTFVLTAKVPGDTGNTCTVTVTGTGASATGSGKLTGGTGTLGAVSTFNLA